MSRQEMLQLADQLEAGVGHVPWFTLASRAMQLAHASRVVAYGDPEMARHYTCGVARMVRELAYKRT